MHSPSPLVSLALFLLPIPPYHHLVNIEEVYIRNKIHLFLGILQSAYEMWYSTNNDVELLHECIKWDES